MKPCKSLAERRATLEQHAKKIGMFRNEDEHGLVVSEMDNLPGKRNYFYESESTRHRCMTALIYFDSIDKVIGMTMNCTEKEQIKEKCLEIAALSLEAGIQMVISGACGVTSEFYLRGLKNTEAATRAWKVTNPGSYNIGGAREELKRRLEANETYDVILKDIAKRPGMPSKTTISKTWFKGLNPNKRGPRPKKDN